MAWHSNPFYVNCRWVDVFTASRSCVWARKISIMSLYPNDMAHNFVLACRRCNGLKSDDLAIHSHPKKCRLLGFLTLALSISQ